MGDTLKTWETERSLGRARKNQVLEAVPKDLWAIPPAGSFNVFVLFNLEALWGEGHAILGMGPVAGKMELYSFYRHSSTVRAPGIMASLRDPMTFTALQESQGWIIHGQPGNYWNEHVNTALAMWCDKSAYQAVHAYAENRKAHTGMYDLVKYNCLTFVEEALAAGGISLRTTSGRAVHTIIPKDAFCEIEDVEGAQRFEVWKYWFPITKAPVNGLRSISDIPGCDTPLE